MYLVGRSYNQRSEPWTLESLSDELRVTGDALETVTARLLGNGLLLEVDDGGSFVPGRDMDGIRLVEVVNAVRDPGNHEDHPEHYVQSVAAVEAVVDEVEGAVADALGDRTLRQLVLGD